MPPDFKPSLDGTQWNALAHYFAGEMSEREAADLRQWIAAVPGRDVQVERLRRAWDVAGRLSGEWDTEAALARMLPPPVSKPVLVKSLPQRAVAPLSTRTPWRPALGWAAAAVAVVATGLGLWRAGAFVASSSVNVAPAEVATRRGQRASLRLPDGTDVMLGPESRIRYAIAGSRGPRAVYLDGEAYFVVAHDAARPFAVHTARAVATDLGTRFGVRAYAEDSMVTVAVAEGKVSLRPAAARVGRDSVLLTRHDLGRVTSSGAVMAQRTVALDRYLAWTADRLVFRDTPLREAVVELGRWYDVEVQLGDSALGAKRVTARFAKEPATRAVELIAASLGLRLEVRGSVLILRAR